MNVKQFDTLIHRVTGSKYILVCFCDYIQDDCNLEMAVVKPCKKNSGMKYLAKKDLESTFKFDKKEQQ